MFIKLKLLYPICDPMTRKLLLGTLIAITFVLSMIMVPAFAGGHLTITSSDVKINPSKLKADITTAAPIPLGGTSGAFGYAILTDGGTGPLDNVLVLVTHLPIDDSSHEDPASGFHTHVLDLMVPSAGCAGHDLEVNLAGSGANAAFDADYNWKIKGTKAKIRAVPVSDLGGATTVIGVTSFTVTPIFAGPTLTNLCVDV